jgi:hypothetical protein
MLAALCALALGSAGAHAHDPYPGVEGHDMPGGHGRCAAWTTGNADHDFALRMHHHHAMAAQLATEFLARGTDPDLRAIAQAHINAHNAERMRLESWLTARNVDFRTMPGGWPYGTFVSVDSNRDGFVDRTEVVATSPWSPYFVPMDVNGDGRISLAESDTYIRAWRPDVWPYGTFVQVDTNRDGFVDRTEVVATSPWSPYFGPMDANGDGRITLAESNAYTRTWRPGPWPGWTFVGVDTNRDGFVDRTEVVATSPMHPHFDQIDSNDDGRATQEEVETFWRTMKYSGPSHAMGPWHCADNMAAHDAGANAPRDVSDKGPPPSFRSSDKNGDGFLARDELAPGDMLLGHFAQADTNNDGRLSAGEVDAHHAAMAEMGRD